MCLTVPGKVINLEKNKALLQVGSRTQIVDINALKKVKKGDWLLSAGDLAIKKINRDEAREIIELLERRRDVDPLKLSQKFKDILRAARMRTLTKEELVYLLKLENPEELEALFIEADVIRQSYLKDFICLHGVIEFSNHCQNNCLYCGLRRDNQEVERYRMNIEEIVEVAEEAVNKRGYKMLVLQSGVDSFFTTDKLVSLVREIKKQCRVFIFMSVGEQEVKTYQGMKEAGARGVLFRFETSNQKLYARLHPAGTGKRDFNQRLKLLKELKKMGYYISSGPIIGIPGQTPADLASDILLMKELGVKMVSMGPFIPCQNTPLAFAPPGNRELSLKMIAITRLTMKESRIPVTTALETLDPKNARKGALGSGANSLMFNLTPAKYRKNYQIYDNKFFDRDKNLEKYALYKGEGSYEMLEKEYKI